MVLPKAESVLFESPGAPADEAEQGLPVGSLDLMPIIETAAGVESAIATATADKAIRVWWWRLYA